MFMRLSEFLENNDISVAEFARLIGVKSRATVYRYAEGLRIPDEVVMPKIFSATNGKVTANDFYNLPPTKKPKRS